MASTETKTEPPPESVTLDDIRSAFEEIEKALAEHQEEPESDSRPDSKTALRPEDFHLRFNQANSIAKGISQAADSLLKLADSLKVSLTNLT